MVPAFIFPYDDIDRISIILSEAGFKVSDVSTESWKSARGFVAAFECLDTSGSSILISVQRAKIATPAGVVVVLYPNWKWGHFFSGNRSIRRIEGLLRQNGAVNGKAWKQNGCAFLKEGDKRNGSGEAENAVSK